MSGEKTINMLLSEGNLEGVISIEDSKWNSGELYSAPRKSVSKLFETEACKRSGVYLLLSNTMVYVGQSSDLEKRINQHKAGKSWWEKVVVLTTKDDSFSHSDIDYLESVLIDKARKLNCYDCDNKNSGNKPKVSKYRKPDLDQYLEEALFLIDFIGITVFNEKRTVDTITKLLIGKRAKSVALSYLEKKDVIVANKKSTYAVKQPERNEFWANPKIACLKQDWWFILNNNALRELVVMRIPAGSLKLRRADTSGLLTRTDKPELIDLNINCTTFVDRKSNVDFTSFVKERIKY